MPITLSSPSITPPVLCFPCRWAVYVRYSSWKYIGLWISFPQQLPSEPSTDSHPDQNSRHSQPHKISRVNGSDFLRKGMIYFLARWMKDFILGNLVKESNWRMWLATSTNHRIWGWWMLQALTVPNPLVGLLFKTWAELWEVGGRERKRKSSRERLRRFVRAWVQNPPLATTKTKTRVDALFISFFPPTDVNIYEQYHEQHCGR